MKLIKSFLVLAIAVLGFSSIDVNAQNYNQAGDVSQQVVEKKVRKEINMLPYYGLFDSISYKVEGDTVTLYGKVVQPTTKSSARNVVKNIKGVSNVVDNIEVLPLSNFDDRIRYQVAQTLANRGGAFYRYLQGASPSVRIIVERGNVSLEGYVATRSDSNLANILTKSIPSVFSVKNNLIVENEINR